MSITVAPSAAFTADALYGPGYTGLTGTVGVLIQDKTGTVITARTTSGIIESPAGSGLYIASLTSPSTSASYTIVWDTGGSSPVYGSEDLTVTPGGASPTPPSGTDLCTLADIHTFGEITGTDRDALFDDCIPAASQAITRWSRRQFYPDATPSTHRFEVHGRLVDLDPYDLQPSSDETPITVTLNPESDAPQVLATPLQYTFEPVGAAWGTYTTMHLSNSNIAWYSTTLINYGYALVDVQGYFGFPAVPIDVVRACVLTILSWTDRAQADYGSADLLDEPRSSLPAYETAYGIPPGARRLLYPFCRNQIRPG